MPLKFNGAWRFNPPGDTTFINSAVPSEAVTECLDLIAKVATQKEPQEVFEHFKGYFRRACGTAHVWSSNEGWAETDLRTFAMSAAKNAPLFIEAFYDACESFAGDDPDLFAPDVTMTNELLAKYRIGYEIQPLRLNARETIAPLVEVVAAPPTLAEKAVEIFQASLARSEALLIQGRAREAGPGELVAARDCSDGLPWARHSIGNDRGKIFQSDRS